MTPRQHSAVGRAGETESNLRTWTLALFPLSLALTNYVCQQLAALMGFWPDLRLAYPTIPVVPKNPQFLLGLSSTPSTYIRNLPPFLILLLHKTNQGLSAATILPPPPLHAAVYNPPPSDLHFLTLGTARNLLPKWTNAGRYRPHIPFLLPLWESFIFLSLCIMYVQLMQFSLWLSIAAAEEMRQTPATHTPSLLVRVRRVLLPRKRARKREEDGKGIKGKPQGKP